MTTIFTMKRQNLLKETLEILKKYDKTFADIIYVITSKNNEEGCIEWSTEQFVEESAYINYDSSYGINKINMTLQLVGETFWIERAEYDGSEWWEYKEIPKRPSCKGNGKIPIFELHG